ncbi:MAG: hypothetical protein HQK89_12480 [Nitrospirae bacterium]|nr:hypothetical protein [Nitrospirota bacterium]
MSDESFIELARERYKAPEESTREKRASIDSQVKEMRAIEVFLKSMGVVKGEKRVGGYTKRGRKAKTEVSSERPATEG